MTIIEFSDCNNVKESRPWLGDATVLSRHRHGLEFAR